MSAHFIAAFRIQRPPKTIELTRGNILFAKETAKTQNVMQITASKISETRKDSQTIFELTFVPGMIFAPALQSAALRYECQYADSTIFGRYQEHVDYADAMSPDNRTYTS